QRHDRETALGGLAEQLVQLFAVEQQFARPHGIVRRVAAMAVLPDVRVEQIRFTALELAEAVAQVDAALANRLDFGAGEDEPGLEVLEQVEVVPGLAVVGKRALGLVLGHGQAEKSANWRSRSLIAVGAPPGHAMPNAGSFHRTPRWRSRV